MKCNKKTFSELFILMNPFYKYDRGMLTIKEWSTCYNLITVIIFLGALLKHCFGHEETCYDLTKIPNDSSGEKLECDYFNMGQKQLSSLFGVYYVHFSKTWRKNKSKPKTT